MFKTNWNKKLNDALYEESSSRVKEALDNGASPNKSKDTFRPPIFEAIRWTDYKSLQHLIDAGADLTVTHDSHSFLREVSRSWSRSTRGSSLIKVAVMAVTDDDLKKESSAVLLSLYEGYDSSDIQVGNRVLKAINSPSLQLSVLKSIYNKSITKYTQAVDAFDVSKFDKGLFSDFLEELAGNDESHEQFKHIFSKLSNPDDHLEVLRRTALNYTAPKNLIFLSVYEDEKWVYDSENPRTIARYYAKEIPGFSLKEIFNFKGQGGERISVMTHIETTTQTPQRESFGTIDDQDLIAEAARELEKRGGKLPAGNRYKTKKAVAPSKACAS